VTFIGRGAHGRAIRERGLIVEDATGRITASGAVLESIEVADDLEFDVVLIAVKWASLEAVAAGITKMVGKSGVVISMLNGLGAEDRLAKEIGARRVIGGIAQLNAAIAEPGRIEVQAFGGMVLAPLAASEPEWVGLLAQYFSRSFPCAVESDVRRARWKRLLWNAPFNALCALTRLRPGALLADHRLETVAVAAMREVIAVAAAEGVPISEAAIAETLAATRGRLANARPSMLQDVLAGVETEVEHIQGEIVRRGREHGIATPTLATLHALLAASAPDGSKRTPDDSRSTVDG